MTMTVVSRCKEEDRSILQRRCLPLPECQRRIGESIDSKGSTIPLHQETHLAQEHTTHFPVSGQATSIDDLLISTRIL